MHEHEYLQDPNLVLIMMPLMDMLNHSNTPNVAIRPFVDKIENQSFLTLQALRDIGPDEHLTVNYGQLNNMSFILKYGFTMFDDSQFENNMIDTAYRYKDY